MLNTILHNLYKTIEPDHPYYYLVQMSIQNSFMWINTTVFTSLYQKHVIGFIMLAQIISRLTSKFFVELLERGKDIRYLTTAGQFLNLYTSVWLARFAFSINTNRFPDRDIKKICVMFILSDFSTNFLLKIIQNSKRKKASTSSTKNVK